jgi:hypothetical protein
VTASSSVERAVPAVALALVAATWVAAEIGLKALMDVALALGLFTLGIVVAA